MSSYKIGVLPGAGRGTLLKRRSNRILERFSGRRPTPQPAQPERSTSDQSRHDRAAGDTIGPYSVPQLEGNSVNEFFLARLRPER